MDKIVDRILAEVDKDGDGRVCYEEFCDMLRFQPDPPELSRDPRVAAAACAAPVGQVRVRGHVGVWVWVWCVGVGVVCGGCVRTVHLLCVCVRLRRKQAGLSACNCPSCCCLHACNQRQLVCFGGWVGKGLAPPCKPIANPNLGAQCI